MANVIYEKVSSPLINLFQTVTTLRLYDDGRVTYNKTRKIFKKNNTTELSAKEVHFYVTCGGFLNRLFFDRDIVYFGAKTQIKALRMNSEDVSKFRTLLINNGSPIGESGQKYSCWSLYNPISWLRKENIYITDSGVRYERGKEMAFIPYNEIMFFFDSPSFLRLRYEVFIAANQFISPKSKVSRRFVSNMKKHFRNDKEDKDSIKVRPGLLWRILHPFKSSRPIVILIADGVLSVDKGNDYKFISYSNIQDYNFEKEHWYSLRGTVEITGKSSSYREDQQEDMDISIVKENVGRCLWSKVKSRIIEKSE